MRVSSSCDHNDVIWLAFWLGALLRIVVLFSNLMRRRRNAARTETGLVSSWSHAIPDPFPPYIANLLTPVAKSRISHGDKKRSLTNFSWRRHCLHSATKLK